MQVFLFLSGIALLLYAMQQMESSLSKLGSGQLQQGLHTFTSSTFKGVLFGLASTAILQSSSIVGLMTMAFVGAGLIPFRNAIGVILGSNMGTTFTGWLVALLGFKLNLTEGAMPILGVGALMMVVFAKGSRARHGGRFVFAFGLLLLGLALMKDSIAFVVDYVDVASLQNLPIIVFFIFGALLTAVIQSSSATMIITLSAVHAGIIELPAAAALIIGADLGTTSTVMIGSIGGSVVKKQVALVHFFFNLVTDVLAILCLPLLLMLVTQVFAIDDPLFGLVAIHSSFNLLGLALFYPFVSLLQKRIESWVHEDEVEPLTIDNVPVTVPEAALKALEKDARQLMGSAIALNARRLSLVLPDGGGISDEESVDAVYASLKNRESLLVDYILEFQRQPLSLEQSNRAQQMLVSIRDVLYATKAIKDIDHDMDVFSRQRSAVMHKVVGSFEGAVTTLYEDLLGVLNQPESFTTDMLAEFLQLAEENHKSCNTSIYEYIGNNDLQKDTASTVLNINREILFSAHSLINALQNLMLPGEQARTVSEILNLKAT